MPPENDSAPYSKFDKKLAMRNTAASDFQLERKIDASNSTAFTVFCDTTPSRRRPLYLETAANARRPRQPAPKNKPFPK
jgi:hypothetical protein